MNQSGLHKKGSGVLVLLRDKVPKSARSNMVALVGRTGFQDRNHRPHNVQTRLAPYLSFLWLLKQIIINRGLKTTETHSLTVWRVEVRNQDVSRAVLPPKALGENPSLSLLVSGGFRVPWLIAASWPSLPPSSHGLLL